MNYSEIIEAARTQVGPVCKACPVCNGLACKNHIPGPGSKGSGTVFARNYSAWQEYFVNMDTICENREADTKFDFFGNTFEIPVFAAPIGAMKLHYGDKYNDHQYNDILVCSCAEAGIAAWVGDGVDDTMLPDSIATIKEYGGRGVPTIKPWNRDKVLGKLECANNAGVMAAAMDVDAAGLPFLKNYGSDAGSKTVAELSEITASAKMPFIVKGIMTVKGAQKALEAGAKGIVVSNHGGRVLDGCPATADVLPEIADAVKGKLMILVDGGIRTGLDVFKAIALGADAVLIGRPFVTMIYGAGSEGVAVYVNKLKAELKDTMSMCGAHSLSEISRDMIYGF